MSSLAEPRVPSFEELQKIVGEMPQRPTWVFGPWQTGGNNALIVGRRLLCEVPMKYELERAAAHAAAACNALPGLVAEIVRLRDALVDIANGHPDGNPAILLAKARAALNPATILGGAK